MPITPPVTVSEACDQTGKPKRTILHAITRGDLPAHKLAGATTPWLIEQADLDQWITGRDEVAS